MRVEDSGAMMAVCDTKPEAETLSLLSPRPAPPSPDPPQHCCCDRLDRSRGDR